MKAVRSGWLPPATRRDEIRLCRCDAIQGDLAAAAFGIARGRCIYTPGPWSDLSIVVNSRKRCLEQVGRPERRWQGEEFRDSSFSSKVAANVGLSEKLRRGSGHKPRLQREHAPWVVGSYGWKAKFIPGPGLFQSASCK